MSGLIEAHGGTLIDRQLDVDAARSLEALPALPLSRRELADLLLIAEGALSPLTGFQGKAEIEHIIEEGRLKNGLAWTLPITLQAKDARPKVGSRLALKDETGATRGVITISELFELDLEKLALKVYGTTDLEHPGVKALKAEGTTKIAGEVGVIASSQDELRLSPKQTRVIFEERGWSQVAAFQTRNPLHRSHEYLLRVALEVSDGLLLHPLVGETKASDVPADVRMACYKALLDNYLPQDRVLLSVLDTAMRYAGPAEAIHHAILRQNYGASKLIVGRDHAGVGGYYGPFDAQARFDRYELDSLKIRPLKLDITFWCNRCGGIGSTKTCPHEKTDHLSLSGSEVRRRLKEGEPLPPEISRPEVAEILRKHYAKS